MHEFDAIVHPEGKWWIIDIPELGQTTQARDAADIQDMATGLAASILDVDPLEVHITVSMQTPDEEPAPCETSPTQAPAIPTISTISPRTRPRSYSTSSDY